MKLDDLPNDMKREILYLVDEHSTLNAISKVSKNFEKLSVQTVTESMQIGLRYYKKHGSHHDKAEIAASLSTGQPRMKKLNQMLRVSLTAYRDGRLIESFARWTYLYEGQEPVTFSREINGMRRVARRMLSTETERDAVSDMFQLRTATKIDQLKERGRYRPRLLMDVIVRYVYRRVMEMTAGNATNRPTNQPTNRPTNRP